MKVKELPVENITKFVEPISAMQHKQVFLTTAEYEGEVRTLTCAWGAFGNVWKKKTVTIYIRPQRHTLPFIEKSGRFTLTFFEGHEKELSYLGTVSAKDEPNKIPLSGLHVTHIDNDPTFEEGKYVLACRVLYEQQLDRSCFYDKDLIDKCYPNEDYSFVIVGEIEAFYEIRQ